MKTKHKFIAQHDLLVELEKELIAKLLIYDSPKLKLRKWGIHY